MIYKVNDLFYFCESKSNRSGFAHIVKILNQYAEVLVESKTQYYNRTWEEYHYQSAMRKAQEKLEKTIKKCMKGNDFINYRYEDWERYDFSNQPETITL